MTTLPPPPPPPPQPPQGGQPPPPPPSGYGQPSGPIGAQKSIPKQIGLAIITFGIYAVYWAYTSHEDIKRHTGEGVGGAVGALIYFFAGIVTLFLLPIEIKNMYERDGRESPVSAMTAFWILLFVIPWYVKCQTALNEYWASKGAPPAA